jgi:acyl-[acyl carrier protein]--UDP-N-acetylglucosamine O-acyltransferase
MYKSGLKLDEACAAIAIDAAAVPELLPLVEFLSQSGRGIVR